MDAIKVKLIGLSRGGGGNLQPDKTATPTKQEQTVRADPGYDGLRQVTVEAIPNQYADVSGVDAGAGDVRVGKVIVGSDGETIIGTMPPQKPEEIGHATPTEQAQTVTPTAGSVFSAVEVEPIPSEYADVSSVDATAADVRTGKTIVDAQGDTVTGEMEPQKPEQVKAATPSTSPQSVTPDTGYALSRVDVGAIPSEYADVSDVTATAGTVLTGSDFVDASGTLVHGACDYDADTSDADATAGQIEAGATAYVGGTKITGTMPIRTADVEIDSLTPVQIPAGSYDGTQYAKLSSAAAANVVAANIRQGAEILGVQGGYQGADTLASRADGTITSYTNDSITNLASYAFAGCVALESVSFANVLSIETYAFYGCSSLNSVIMPRLAYINGNYGFASATSLRNISLPSLTRMDGYAFTSSGIQSVSFPELTTFRFTQQFWRCPNLETIVLPKATSLNNSSCRDCPNLTLVDLGDCASFGTDVFLNSTLFGTLILRKDAICALSNTNAFNGTKFASGGTGGTIYIPETLYNHLGDGTALDYKAATNWSVIDAYGTITWAKIEGSQYEVTP